MRLWIEKPEIQNRTLEPTGLANCGKTRGLMGTGPGLARQDSAGRVFRCVCNRTDSLLRGKHGSLAGYPDPLPTLIKGDGWLSISIPIWRYWPYAKLYPSQSHLHWFQATMYQLSTHSQVYSIPLAWLRCIRFPAQLRAQFRDTESCIYVPLSECWMQSPIGSWVTREMPMPCKLCEINLWWNINPQCAGWWCQIHNNP